MPFKKMDIKKLIEEKRLEPSFDESYKEIKKEYDFVQSVVEKSKLRDDSNKWNE